MRDINDLNCFISRIRYVRDGRKFDSPKNEDDSTRNAPNLVDPLFYHMLILSQTASKKLNLQDVSDQLPENTLHSNAVWCLSGSGAIVSGNIL